MFYLVKITINNVKFNLKLMSHIVFPYNQNFSLHRNEVNKLQDGALQQPNFVDVTKG